MNQILIKIKNLDKYELINKLCKNKIYFNYLNNKKNTHYIKIYKKDFIVIKKLFKKSKIIKYYGKEGIIKFIKNNFIFLICILWGLFLLNILSHTVFSIEIKTNNEEIKDILIKELNNYDIKKYSRKKSYKELMNIKKNIVKNNEDKLEWLEIKNDGTKCIVELTERIIIEEKIKSNFKRHIVAKKDALIKHITATEGDILKEINEYVKKGEIIISGNIYKNEETLIKQVRAEGEVYGEVWYIVKAKVPFNYVEYVRTGEVINHYYIELFNKKMTLTGKYETTSSMNHEIILVNKPYLFFKLVKEVKEIYKYKEFNVDKESALKEAIKRSDKSIKNQLEKNEYIIDKKVLNIYPYSSKIEVEIFYKVYENITDVLVIQESG